VQSSVTFLKNGDTITDTIVDVSSQTGQVEFRSHAKIHRSRIWMINFVNSNWDFPAERQLLVSDRDTVFLRNGQRLNVNIVDFSSRRRTFDFRVGGRVHEDKVKRIYFCCIKLPAAYKEKKEAAPGEFYSVTFMVDGRIIESPLSYLNSRKTGFQDELQVNTKDIWMINLEDDSLDFPRERVRLSNKVDTIFPVNGRVFFDTVTGFNGRNGTFSFRKSKPIHYSQITRIYFCCTKFPEVFKKRGRYKQPKRIKRRY
jgi:hypothetical protein